MASLALLTELLDRPEWGLRFERAACLRSRLNTCDCRHCLDVCPAGALRLNGREIHFMEQDCTGCLRCLSVCPNEALRMSPDVDLIRLFGRRPPGGNAVISCFRQKQQHPDEIVVPCFGMFSRELLLYLGRAGLQTVRFTVAGCTGCVNRAASHAFQADLSALRERGARFLTTVLQVDEGTLSEIPGKNDRRGFLAGLKKSLIDPAGERGRPSVGEVGSRKKRRVPQRTKLIGDVVAGADDIIKAELRQFATPRLRVRNSCTCCPLCTGICPTGAIRVTRHGAGRDLEFNRDYCTSCGLCVVFCKRQALSLSPPPLTLG